MYFILRDTRKILTWIKAFLKRYESRQLVWFDLSGRNGDLIIICFLHYSYVCEEKHPAKVQHVTQ